MDEFPRGIFECRFCLSMHSPSVNRTWGVVRTDFGKINDAGIARKLVKGVITDHLTEALSGCFAFAHFLNAATWAVSEERLGNPYSGSVGMGITEGPNEHRVFQILDECDTRFSGVLARHGCGIVQPGSWSVARDMLDGAVPRSLLTRVDDLLALITERGLELRTRHASFPTLRPRLCSEPDPRPVHSIEIPELNDRERSLRLRNFIAVSDALCEQQTRLRQLREEERDGVIWPAAIPQTSGETSAQEAQPSSLHSKIDIVLRCGHRLTAAFPRLARRAIEALLRCGRVELAEDVERWRALCEAPLCSPDTDPLDLAVEGPTWFRRLFHEAWSDPSGLRPKLAVLQAQLGLPSQREFSASERSASRVLTRSAPAAGPEPGVGSTDLPSHAEDFSWIRWRGRNYSFAGAVQRAIIKSLYEDWEKNGSGLSAEYLLDASGSNAKGRFRVDDRFKVKGPGGSRVPHAILSDGVLRGARGVWQLIE